MSTHMHDNIGHHIVHEDSLVSPVNFHKMSFSVKSKGRAFTVN